MDNFFFTVITLSLKHQFFTYTLLYVYLLKWKLALSLRWKRRNISLNHFSIEKWFEESIRVDGIRSSPRLEELGGTKIYIDRRANRVYIAIDIMCQYNKNGEWVCCGKCIKRAASTDIDTNVIDKILLTRNEMKIIFYNMIFLNYIYFNKTIEIILYSIILIIIIPRT